MKCCVCMCSYEMYVYFIVQNFIFVGKNKQLEVKVLIVAVT